MLKLSISILSSTRFKEVDLLHDQLLIELLAQADIGDKDIVECWTTPKENYVVLNKSGTKKLIECFLS